MSETDLWFGTLSATVRVEDLPASRRVVAIELPVGGEWRVCGAGTSNSDGIATLPITGLPNSRIYAVAIDEWGQPFMPNMSVNYGDLIRPTQFVGWMYQVTQPGALPTTEPDWWNARAGIPQPVGTAMMQAIRHYQPIAHGPVSDIEWEELEFDPHWDKVVALLHFDGSDGSTLFSDETGRLWAAEGSARISTENKVFGSGSGRFDGSQNTRISSPASPDFLLGTKDFVIEAGVYISGNSAFSSGGQRTAAIFAIARPQGASLEFSILGDSNKTGTGLGLWNGSTLVSVAGEIAHGEWHRLKVARHGSTFKFFLNGNQLGADQTAAISFGSATVGAFIGGNVVTGYNYLLNGYIDEFRLTVGESRHTEPSDPPTAPFPNVGPPL